MAELRHLLGLLNPEGEEVALTPQPGAEQLDALVRRVGLPVELRTSGEPRILTPGMNLTVYRIVQEALTNSLKYSGLAHRGH